MKEKVQFLLMLIFLRIQGLHRKENHILTKDDELWNTTRERKGIWASKRDQLWAGEYKLYGGN